jgi:hypothetical protein
VLPVMNNASRIRMRIAIVVTLLMVWSVAALSQVPDWIGLFENLTSKDEAVSDAARRKAFGTLLPALGRADAKTVAEDLKVILTAFQREEPIRFQAAALLAGLSYTRADGEVVLAAALPSLLKQLDIESSPGVRENIVRTIAVLRPNIPDLSPEPLIQMQSEARQQTVQAASVALVRLGAKSPLALQAVKKSMSAGAQEVRLTIVDTIGYYKLADEGSLSVLAAGLQDKNSRIVLAAIRSIERIGSPASVFKKGLEEIIKTHTDTQVVAAATSALPRIK